MKKILLLLVVLVSSVTFAQNNGITYQAVIYSTTGESVPGIKNSNSPLVNKAICLQFSIVDENTQTEYQEKVTVTTDDFGMVNLVIGNGTQTGGYANSFNAIVWASSQKYLKVSVDQSGNCSSFELISDQLLNYVPYALAANSAASVFGVVGIANGGTNATTVVGAKTNLQLQNVDNTSDLNKPLSTASQTALNTKVDKVTGKDLSTEDFTTAEKTKLAAITGTNTGDQDLSSYATNVALTSKVDQVIGKELSSNDYTTVEKNKLAAITGTNTGDQDLSSFATTTSVALKANTTDVTSELATKVDKVTGKELSSNDYTTVEKNKLADISGTNTGDQDLSSFATTTSVALKANTTDVTSELATKVDKVTGKELSSNDYTTVEKNKLAAITGTNTGDQDLSSYATTTSVALKANTTDVTSELATKVDKVTGKELSSNDYTTVEKTKLAAITGTNTGDQDLTSFATTTSVALKANTISPNFLGLPTAPTAASGTNTSQLATTAFVTNETTGKFVDITTNQTIAGNKTFSSDIVVNGIKVGNGGGSQSTVIGDTANGTLDNSTALGFMTLDGNSGTNNTAVGTNSMRNSGTTSMNTSVGVNSGTAVNTGNGNTYVGHNANVVNNSTISNATAIGADAIVTASNTIQLGAAGENGTTPISNVKTSGTLTAGAVTYPNAHGTTGQVLTTNGNGNLAWTDKNIGTGTQGYLTKWASTTTSGSSIIYDNGTQIGIGTTSPTGIFEVSGSSSTTNDQYFGYANGNIQGIGLSWPGTEILQTFTAGISGNLSKISVFSYGSNNNVVLKIYAGSNSQGSILYTSSPINFVNGAIVDMNIPNIVVTIGQAYTFQLQSSSNIVLAGSSGPYQVSNGTTPKSSGSSSTIVNPGYGNITSSGGIFFNTYVTSLSGSMVFENNGTVTATSFKTPSGTSSQYLMADGSVSSGSSGSTSASVDLTTNQTIAGNKTFSSDIMVNGLTIGKGIGQVNDQNITVGENTLVNNTTGQLLIAIGNGSLYSNTSANYNLGIGASTLSNNQTGENNIAIGVASLNSNTGANNTAIGRSASQLGGANSNITSLGFQAGMRNTGNSNTFLGANTDQNSPSSSITNSTALGFGAKISAANQIQLGNTSITNVNTSGSYTGSGFKTPTGTSSQYLMADGSVSSGSSSSSGVPYTGATGSVDLGTYDLKVNGLTLGIGAGAQPSNVVLGKSAMENNSTGGYSVAVGFEALKSITNGNSNTAVGYQALKSNTTGGANIAIGMNAMLNNINGSQNIAIGQSTLNNNTSASGNTVIGHSAGVNISTGGSNTIIGQEAAGGLTTGSWNTIIGRNAYTGNISNNIVLSNGQGTIKAQHDGTNWTLSGTTTATGFKTPSGTSSQYLMADGSVSSVSSVSSGPQILTKAQRDALNLTSSGVMIFNTTTNQYQGSVYYTTGYNYNYFTNNIYGISEIKPGHSITQTFTGKGQVITSADIAVVNMNRPGISNTGNFTFEIWDETYQYALFSTTITLNGAGTVSVTIPNNSWYNLPTTLPNGPCSFRITSDSVTGGSADFLMNAGPSVGSLSNTYWASLGGTSNGYTTPTTSHQLAIDLFPQNGLTWVNFN